MRGEWNGGCDGEGFEAFEPVERSGGEGFDVMRPQWCGGAYECAECPDAEQGRVFTRKEQAESDSGDAGHAP